ncbi:MAG TPA: asparagine synthase (glutamine-hydrolyzing) [Xanthobacteraceae bacterium]|nr:asparagine synthase (glutamine-hydrolyzing) [Xanthobacteraceae bacterium]
MCGIAGYFGRPSAAVSARALLRRMIGAVAHRGPDAQGFFVADEIGFGHARLSILDLTSGHQPMANADQSVWITFNGEIFNYVELREELIARGRRFATTSDTEVILQLYEEFGPDCVSRLNGDFAFALWDARRRRLMLARDRMGVRPLFYTRRNGTLYFASEIKALLEVPGVSAELDPVALDQIFTFWFPLAPRTAFKDIDELKPAHVLIADAHGMVVRPYWRLDYPRLGEEGPHDARAEAALADEVEHLLLDATRIRLRADVPVGAYLSGGLDSSLVAAAAKRFVAERLRTFSLTFESAEFDESEHQLAMARALGTAHESVACTAADIARLFPQAIRHGERPILRTAPAPLLALSDLAHRSGFKVVLTGEGADEVFAGYDLFKEAKLRRFCARQPQSRRRPLLFRRLYPYLPGLKAQPARYLEAFFGAGIGPLDDPLFSHLPRLRTTAGAKAFFSRDLRSALAGYDALAELRESLPAEFARWHPLSQAQYLETAYLLPGYILSSQGDRVAMAHAVEGRFPFLDHRVVELGARIAPQLKLNGLTEKHILRKSAARLLPAAIADRAKQPYRAPDAQAFLGPDSPDYVARRLAAADLAVAGYFDPAAVERLLAKCRNGKFIGFRDNMAFVGILSTQLWQREFVLAGAGTIASAVA